MFSSSFILFLFGQFCQVTGQTLRYSRDFHQDGDGLRRIAAALAAVVYAFHVLASVLRMIACAPHHLWKDGGLFERRIQNFFEKKKCPP
jgi:hypothetical protein